MVVRLTSFKVSDNDAGEVKKIYNGEVVPEVKKQQGNTNVMLLEPTDGSGEFISLTSWASKTDADAYHSSGKYKELVAKITGLIGDPVLKTYTA